MLVHMGDYHELEEVRSVLRGRHDLDPLQTYRMLRPNALAASDMFRSNWRQKDALPEVVGKLLVGVKFFYDRQYNPSLFKRARKTRSGYNADILLFSKDLSNGETERPTHEIYAEIENQLAHIIGYIRQKNDIF